VSNPAESEDLEALFDSIVKANEPASSAKTDVVADTAVASAVQTPAASPVAEDALTEPARTMYSQVGQITRKLHDALRDMGYDKKLEIAASAIPDARDRLKYIATLTEQAAEKVLNAVDSAKPVQDKLEQDAKMLSARWDKLFARQLSIDEFKKLVQDTRSYIQHVPRQVEATNTQLLDIMMAQDFQDLTGQVIKKIVEMAKEMEAGLLEFLVEFSPQKAELPTSLMNGPVYKTDGRTDVVTSQEQVDDLLESLGF
jgi:chemotaxis protein CheZ